MMESHNFKQVSKYINKTTVFNQPNLMEGKPTRLDSSNIKLAISRLQTIEGDKSDNYN